MSYFELKEQQKKLARLYSQIDILRRIQRDTANQQDALAVEVEKTRLKIAELKISRQPKKFAPIKMEII